MYVCICNTVRDRDIRRAVEDGARSMKELQLQLGVASSCGRCAPCARERLEAYINEVRRDNAQTGALASLAAAG